MTKSFTLYAKWTETRPSEEPVGIAAFHDVKTGDWFYDDVQKVVAAGLMNGTSEQTFSPNEATTRGMIVAVLYRIAGEPEVSSALAFHDVAGDAYYAKAISWAAAQKIVDNGLLKPQAKATRAEVAAMLTRMTEKFSQLDLNLQKPYRQLSDCLYGFFCCLPKEVFVGMNYREELAKRIFAIAEKLSVSVH